MATLLDRLLGRTEPVIKAELVEAKAATGPGAYSLEFYPQVTAFSADPNLLMNEALGLYRSNPWVALAERTIIGPILDCEWHLEDENGDTISTEPGQDNPPRPNELDLLNLLRYPVQAGPDSKGMKYRSLAALTLRHEGLIGNACWYLDGVNLKGTPSQLIYINPVRLQGTFDSNGNQLGWLLDGPSNRVSGRVGRPGVPFTLQEIKHFKLDEPDFGIWGIGIAEATQAKIELDRLATRHSAQVFASGGRLTGLVSPKAGVEVQPEQWQSLVRDWRNITSDPDAAKRLIVAAAPVDFIQTSSSNEQLQLKELAGQGRDDILFSWGVPTTQAGGSAPAGLNSGATKGFDEATLWQKPIAYRLRPYLEGVQEIVDLWQNMGVKVTFVLDTPTFDDETPQYENAVKARSLPLTIDQRLEMIGHDPLDEKVYGKLGQAIFMDQTMVPLFDPTTPEPPPVTVSPVPPPQLPPTQPMPQLTTGEVPVKASPLTKPLLGVRSQLQPQWERKVRKALDGFLADQRESLAQNISGRYGSLVKKPKDVTLWWNGPRWNRKLNDTLSPLVNDYAATVSRRVTRTVKRPTKKADPFSTAVLERVRSKAGERITRINETTREAVQALVEQGLEDGLGPAELASLISEGTAFNEARAELIARTETALIYNDAALGSYTELGVTEVEAVDGDEDEECAQRDGQVYSVEEAETIEDHPNGTLDWIPLEPPEPIKAEVITGDAMADGFSAMRRLFESPPPPAPIVNVKAPPAPDVSVTVDSSQFAAVISELKAEMARPKKLIRNEQGRIVGVE